MTDSSLTLFLVFWGVWLLIPLLVDVFETLHRSWIVWRHRRFAAPFPPLPRVALPKVSIIIPAYNEQLNIDRCITGLKAQTYPHHLIEIIVINDGSTDRTGEVVNGHITGAGHWNGHIRLHNQVIAARDFGGVLTLVQGRHAGKPAAVNQGLSRARGDLIIALDADVVLEPEAIEQIVAGFRADETLAAATAHLIIDSQLLVVADSEGHVSLDAGQVAIPRPLSLLERFLTAAQFLEYLTAFRIGRHAEAISGDLFTLSGACAIFRRSALVTARGYRGRTVSEDTDATLAMHRNRWKVGYIPQARVHLAPVVAWGALYAQRVRWQRGELEAGAANADMLGRPGRFWRWSLPRRLQNDHAMAMLRLVWGLMLPLFPILGYPATVVAQASLAMYLMYLAADAVSLMVAFPICAPSERRLLRRSMLYLPLMPLYRTATYFFRVSGILRTLTEPPRWTASHGTLERLRLPPSQRLRRWVRALMRVWAD